MVHLDHRGSKTRAPSAMSRDDVISVCSRKLGMSFDGLGFAFSPDMHGAKSVLVPTLLFAICCGSRDGSVATTPRHEPPAAEARPSSRPTPPALDALVNAVDQLPVGLDDRSHASLILTLRRLADALDISYEAADQPPAARIREIAKELEASGDRSVSHAALVAEAFHEALSILERRLSEGSRSDARAAYLRAVRAAGRVRSDAPLLEQQAHTLDAFTAITHVLLVEHGALSPFVVAPEPHERSLGRMRSHTISASAAVAEVATSAGERALGAAAKALDEISLAVASAPIAESSRRTLDDLAIMIRFEAARLRRVGELSAERSDRIKAGLSKAVDALDVIARGKPATEARPMLRRAREASASVNELALFTFQRAAIQEAFRAIVDTLVVLAECDRAAGAACWPANGEG